MPDLPSSARFLNVEEKMVAVERVATVCQQQETIRCILTYMLTFLRVSLSESARSEKRAFQEVSSFAVHSGSQDVDTIHHVGTSSLLFA